MARKRPKRKPLPRVGPRQAGEVRLNPRLKARLKKRAAAEARAQAKPEIRALKKQKKIVAKGVTSAKKAYRSDQRAIQGSIAFGQKYIGKTSLKGLKGRDRQEVAKEIAMTQKDVAASAPMLTAEARGEMRDEIADVREEKQSLAADIADARAQMMSEAAANYAEERRGAVEEAQSAIQRQRTKRQEKREEKGKGSDAKQVASEAKSIAKNELGRVSKKGMERLLVGEKTAIAELTESVRAKTPSREGVNKTKIAAAAVRSALKEVRRKAGGITPKGVAFRTETEKAARSR